MWPQSSYTMSNSQYPRIEVQPKCQCVVVYSDIAAVV